jgi:hypothetical protein
MTWEERAAAYETYARSKGFPPCFALAGDWAYGVWVMGNDYRVSTGYHGGYPPTYLRRVKALFPDKQRVLHLFSGRVNLEEFPGDTVDINVDLMPTYLDDAQTLMRVPLETYDLVLADPPYTGEDADKYGTTMVKRNAVLRALERLPSGAHVVWLDQMLPMYRKTAFKHEAAIGIVRSTNHRFRVVTIWRRL